ncbi:hypothetical protein FRZ67_01380 [Panacibacter ginsenosidivorans]|uniref:DUF3575 domain-containing protein n=1 Tax=Panacibacter ginsenosidivorans TaxID=1813871 RepID=A0A5B8V3L8_9BACT|nr:hypothetical protein [Panacibacter ginsenosidivorans]QEC66020.1 hypothetical protein FRZ67_01380 [Panacibacter ginsenosidivorans]
MKKIILSVIILTTILSVSKAQSTGSTYENAIGIKIYPAGITFKHFLKENRAVEGIAYFWNYGSRATGLYEFHGDIPGIDGLKWYAGPGIHVGFWNDKWKKDYPVRDAGIAIGIDGVGGLDYKFKAVPINIFVDWQPSFNFVGYNYFEAGWGGTGVRYTF